MSTLVTRPRRRLRLLGLFLGLVPWVAINLYWVRIGELRSPIWMIVMNFFTAETSSLQRPVPPRASNKGIHPTVALNSTIFPLHNVKAAL